jgi:hypothetical protein
VTFDKMCWPDPNDPCDIAWKLRYDQQNLTPHDFFVAASVFSAYHQLVVANTQVIRNQRVASIRAAAKRKADG